MTPSRGLVGAASPVAAFSCASRAVRSGVNSHQGRLAFRGEITAANTMPRAASSIQELNRLSPGRGDAPGQGRVSAFCNKPYPLDKTFLKQ